MSALSEYTHYANDLVRTQVRKEYHDLETAKEQLECLSTSMDLAAENLRLNKLSFNAGAASSIEVIDAELALEKVKMEQMKALYDYDVALVNLLASAGDAAQITGYMNNGGVK
jgi:outer membrane protein TolC